MADLKKTILFIMPRLPFPTISGRKASLYHYCRILSEEMGFRLIVAAFLEEGDDPSLKTNFIERLVVLPKTSAKIKVKNICIDSLILNRKPMQVSLYWNKKAKELIDKLVEEEHPDIVIADMVRSTEYIKDLNIYKIADLDDRISLRYRRQLEADIDGINPYGAYLTTLPKFLQKIMLWKPIKEYVVKNEIKLLTKYEIEVGRICDSTIFVAQSEAMKFNKELGEKKAVSIPIGVDVDYFSYSSHVTEDNYIGFLGALSVAHNENAVKHFIEDILPFIKKQIPDARFLIIGGGASENLLKYKSDNIEFTGRVDDVRGYLKRCKVFVCPMTFGSGIKTKNLEAMAMGLPVVTSSIGAENIDAVNNKDWIISDISEEFAHSVALLLENDAYRIQMGKNASQYVNNCFTWRTAEDGFRHLLMS